LIQQVRRGNDFHRAAREAGRIAGDNEVKPCGRRTSYLQAIFEVTTAQGCCGLQFSGTNGDDVELIDTRIIRISSHVLVRQFGRTLRRPVVSHPFARDRRRHRGTCSVVAQK
jgi:hypothetical protein